MKLLSKLSNMQTPSNILSSSVLPALHRVEPESAPETGVDRHKKRERRLRRDQVQRIRGWQQYRVLWDGIDFKRQIINLGDKKVRFALVIMGALNAVLLLFLSHDPLLRYMPAFVRVIMAVLLLFYGFVTFRFMAHAIEALRPSPEARANDAVEWTKRETPRAPGNSSVPMGFIIRGPLQNISYDDEQFAWNHARLCDINSELILFNRASSYMVTHQHDQLRKVYQNLKALVLLGAAAIVLVVAAGMASGGDAKPESEFVGAVGARWFMHS